MIRVNRQIKSWGPGSSPSPTGIFLRITHISETILSILTKLCPNVPWVILFQSYVRYVWSPKKGPRGGLKWLIILIFKNLLLNEKLKTVIKQCPPNQLNKVVLMGDLNENLLQPSTEFNLFLEHIRTRYSLQPCNFQQTTDYHSCLDHVYTNVDASVSIQETYWTDHELVWLQIAF